MKKIFAYTKGEKLSKDIIQALVEADYIPIRVDSFDSIRVIEPLPDLSLDDASIIFAAALETIRNKEPYLGPDVKTDFANRIADRTIKKLGSKTDSKTAPTASSEV